MPRDQLYHTGDGGEALGCIRELAKQEGCECENEIVQLCVSRSKKYRKVPYDDGRKSYLHHHGTDAQNFRRSGGTGMKIPRILLAAGSSGSGKTLITCGLLQALMERGVKTASFKCGPTISIRCSTAG